MPLQNLLILTGLVPWSVRGAFPTNTLIFTLKTKHPFKGMPVLGVKLKRALYVFWLFYNIDLGSDTSMESSRRDLLNYMAEHRPILKNKQNTHYPLLFRIDLCSATSMESSRRDL